MFYRFIKRVKVVFARRLNLSALLIDFILKNTLKRICNPVLILFIFFQLQFLLFCLHVKILLA